MATMATAVLSAETVQEAVRYRQVPHEVGIARMEGVATRHEPQGVVSNVGISAGGGSHEQQVVRGNGTDSTRIIRWEKPRGAIRGTPRGVRGGVATPPTRLVLLACTVKARRTMDVMNVEEYKTWIGAIARRYRQSQI